MAITYTSSVFENTYKDDYRDSDNYYRVLFNSGKALQARELTQLQTIIQSEIGRFARNIFHEGAMVSPGGITVNNKLEYLKLDTTTNSLGTTAAGAIYQGNDNIRVEVLRVEPADTTAGDPATLYVKYIKTDEALASSIAVRIADGENLTKISGTGPNTLTLASSAATGTATIAHVAAGDYFTKNHFVFADNQSILVSKYSNSPTTDLGFLITEDIVTVEDNVNLYDNQGAVPNTASPGADRYRIRLTLTTRDKLDTEANFVYIARIVNGQVSLEATGFSEYNRFNDLLAQRTKEESGDYIIDPFITKFENLNDSNLTLNVNPGVAYVDGYRLETAFTKLTVPKTRTYEVNEKSVVAQYGNYVVQNTTSSNAGVPNINTFAQVNLYNATGGTGTILGTAHVRGAERYASDIRWYLFDIRMNEGQSFSLVRSFGSGSSDYVDLRLTDGIALLNDTSNNSLLFPLPYTRARTAVPDSLVVQKRYTFTSDGSGSSGAIPPGVYPSGTSLTFTDPGDWIVTKLDGSISNGDTGSISVAAGGTSFTITGLSNSTQYEVLALVSIATPQVKTKTRNTTSVTMAWPADADSDGAGLKWLTLPHTDIYEFIRTRLTDSDGIDLTANFTFDNGQRDNFYTKGRLIQKPNLAIPTGNVYSKYTYYAHGDGHFFSVNSYAAYNYDTISSHRKNNGETISLADVLDFRPNQIGVSGSDNYKDSSTSVTLLPQNNNVIDMDNSTTYWLPRKDKLVIKRLEATSNKAELDYITGEPSLTPIEPNKPDGSMHLYSFNLNPYLIHDSDFTSQMIENKGYTMKEIGELERRIDRLEEYTTLNLLEANTALQLVLDSAGNPRTKSGFLADPFRDLSFAEMNGEYRASLDQEFNTLVPSFGQKNVRLIFDSIDAGNTNVTLTGDLLTLSYSETNHITQDLATETENVNPYDVVIIGGHTVLSPSSDDWVETRYIADNIINRSASITGTAATLRNALRNGWLGGGTVVGSNIVRRQIGDRVVSISVIPWMRSKKVSFMSTGLRPNTRYFAYFNDTAVDNWVRETNTSAFVRYSRTTESFGNLYANATQHPDGASILVSDETGTLKGSFFIPSTNAVRFRTGTCVFKLLDVSGNVDANATSWSTATFTSAGTLVTRQRDILSTRVNIIAPPPPPDTGGGGGVDPLAQTFFIDGVENPNGIFATSVDLYFKTKDAVEPVRVQIAEVQNGTPTMNYLPGADAYVYPANVNIPANTNNLASVRAAPTRFTFEEPVYLSPNSEYAIIIKANTTAYNAYVAKTYEFLLGTTAARVNKQPTLGSLFTSQNASTWTPDQTRDLMFKLNRAEFDLDGTAVLRNGPIENYMLDNNPLRFAAGDSDMWVYYPGHGFSTNDLVEISGLTDSIAGITAANINGTRLIREVDWSGFKVGVGSQATTTLIGGGSDIQIEQQAYFDEVFPAITTITPQQTAISAGAKFTSGGSYAGTLKNRSTGTNINAKSSSYSPIIINQPNELTSPNVILSGRNETRWLAGDNSTDIQITMVTLDNKVSPVIDLQRASMMLTENRIDWQDAVSTAGRNVPMFYTAETEPTGGSSASKHLTKQITLAEPAVGLKILLSANRPTESDFLVYYKTGTGDDVLNDKVWTLLAKQSELPGDNDGSTYREYDYLAGGIGGQLAPFTKYQVKIVPVSQNSSRIPRIKDLRVIALAT